MRKEEVAPILKKWLPIYLCETTKPASKKKIEKELLKVYSEERKQKEVEKYYNKYLVKYLDYSSFTKEDCLHVVDEAIIQTINSNKIKKQLYEVDIEQLSDGYIANLFEKILNPNIATKLKDYIAKQNGTTKYTLNILRKIDENKYDLFTQNKEKEKQIIEFLGEYKDGQARNTTAKPEELLYKLRRTVSDEYSYLREFLEKNRQGLTRLEQQKLEKKIIKAFADTNKNKKVFASMGVIVDKNDLIVFNEYFLSTDNIIISKFEKEYKIKNVRINIEKLQDIFLHF